MFIDHNLYEKIGRQENENLYSIRKALNTQQGLIVDIQRELVARPAIGPEYGGDGEGEKACWLADWLHERGVEFERLDFPDERVPSKVRPNIMAIYPGAGQGRTLWLLSHLDVAQPDGANCGRATPSPCA